MMDLLFVTGTPTSVRAGSGTAVGISVLRDSLEAQGHRVRLLAPSPGPTGSVSTVERLRFAYRIRHAAREHKADAVVAFDLDGVFLARSGAPHAAAVKGVLADELRFERGRVRTTLRIQSWFERAHVRRADIVITPSRYSAGRIQALYGRPVSEIRIVPELIDLARWNAALASASISGASGLTILCVAHLYPRKNVHALLAALARSRSRALLRIVGIGPELSRLKTLARDLGLESRVDFPGHLPYASLAAEYRRADVFCLPSLQEGFGIVFLEAMAAGLPIVAVRAGAVPEVVTEGQCGLFAQPGDVDGLAQALDRLLEDEGERRRLAEGGRKRVRRYDAPRVAAEFLDALTRR
jgi:glycosyltransferase involved in cell wall biosynthesis